MQLLYKIISGSPTGYVPLLDEAAGDTLETDHGTFRGVVQKEPLAGGTSMFREARGNVTSNVAVKWTSTYASSAAARAAIATVNALKMKKLHLKFVDGATTQYVPNAISESYEYDHQGKSVTHTLNFEGDDLTAAEPT